MSTREAAHGLIGGHSRGNSKGKETNLGGKATKTALIGFQKAYDIKPTGIVDQETRSVLNALME
ncbi:peptidoglycan-binding protein [Patescibacteria group bacterium]|nr:peptidoglycan-binding protein [Patescibacteria group bacterium]